MKFKAEDRERGRGFWKGGSKLEVLGECCKLPSGVRGRSHDRCGCTKSPENASIGHKCRLVPVSRFDSVERLDATGGTLRFCGSLVEKHCSTTLWTTPHAAVKYK